MSRLLAPADFVTPKELAAAADLSERTIRDRMHLWEDDPAHPRGIPYLRNLGRPYKIPRRVAERILGQQENARA